MRILWDVIRKENTSVIWTQSKMPCEDQIQGRGVRPDSYLQAKFSWEELLETSEWRGAAGEKLRLKQINVF